MDPVGVPLSNDVQQQSQQSVHRQSILGSFLRVRPRGTSQSHQQPNLQLEHTTTNDNDGRQVQGQVQGDMRGEMLAQPPSPNPVNGHRRRPAAAGGGLQPSISAAAHGFNIIPPSTTSVAVHGLSQMLRRRRSANGALNSSSANQSMMNSPVDAQHAHAPTPALPPGAAVRAQPGVGPPMMANPNARTHRIRLVPHLDSSRSLHFEPICRDVREGDPALRIGRFTDRSGLGVAALNAQNTNKLAFKSKVVSRAHAEVWCEPGGKFYIKDTKSSSGTFLNHIRLSAPNTDSKPFPIKDGDVLQLGVDYQGGTEEIYKCVKMRIELGREWQAQPNAFNTNALKQLKALSAQPLSANPTSYLTKPTATKTGISDCCICLFSVTVHQSLFIAPCSHVFHYKCIRPMLLMHHPGFSCPLCRTFANLEEDVEIELEEPDYGVADGVGEGEEKDMGSGESAEGQARPNAADAMDVDSVAAVVSNANAVLTQAAAQSQANVMSMAGAETEVERDFAPLSPNSRRRNYTGALPNVPNVNSNNSRNQDPTTLRNRAHVHHAYNNHEHSLSPTRHGHGGRFEGVPEDADEYVSAGSAGSDDLHFHDLSAHGGDDGTGEETDDFGAEHERDHENPLPPLPVPTPNGALPLPASASASMPPGMQVQGFGMGMGIQRPMSVPISGSNMNNNQGSMFRSMALDEVDAEGSEDELSGPHPHPGMSPGMGMRIGVGVGMGMGVGGDGNASGSSSGSGEGPLGAMGMVGAGEKRKR